MGGLPGANEGDDVKELIEQIAKALVDHPEQVSVMELSGAETTVYELTVAQEDVGQVIGKNGILVASMREIMRAVSGKQQRRLHLEILGDTP